VSTLPKEARDGLMRAFLKVLSDRHPNVTWVPVNHQPVTADANPMTRLEDVDALARSA
jgi:hypothetical protein